MKVRFNGTILCFYLAYYLYAEIWRAYDTQWVGLEVWGRCVLYARQQSEYHMHAKNCILHARQTRAYPMHAKVSFCVLIARNIFFGGLVYWKYNP